MAQSTYERSCHEVSPEAARGKHHLPHFGQQVGEPNTGGTEEIMLDSCQK